jgi:transglutaminase-like putative cysteine protease
MWACAAFVGGVLLHIDRVPAWAVGAALSLLVWRLILARTGRATPGLLVRAVLALVLAAVVLQRFHTLNGLAAGTTLLMLMTGLKLLETRGARDQRVVVAAGLFLLLAACLDRQDLARLPLYAAQAWLCCAALAVIGTPGTGARLALRLSARALLLALPLAVLLFLFFPRLQGAFWAVPRGEQAVTGLSDTMTPGGIGQLASSYDPAFRVRFTEAVPPMEERYWRGPVLHAFDGYTWRALPTMLPRQPLEYLGTAYHYHLTLEPSRRPWWYALDTPVRSPDAERVRLTSDQQLIAAEPVMESLSFDAVSYTHTRASQPLDGLSRRLDTALPHDANPRSRALAQELRQRAGSDGAFVQAVLEYLRVGGFTYSLEPERLGADAIDDFLFRTRIGFCGHYASAFVVLMRAAGVPARVVTGYLGGEWDPYGGYYLVRQSDAHAWAEVWLPSHGWTRVDPTAVVAPERLQRGIVDLMPDALPARARLLHASPWLARLVQRWDAANAWWAERVVKFDYAAQLDLLTRFGIRTPDARYLGWAFMLALGGWLTVLAWHIGRGSRPARPDVLARAYHHLCRKLARVAPARAPYQGPMSFAAAVSAGRPDLAEPVRQLLGQYARLRYGPPEVDAAARARSVEEFRRAVTRLSLPRVAAPTAASPT